MPRILPPRSGNQYTIQSGEYQAVIAQQGASLRSLTYQGKNVIVPFDADDMGTTSQGRVLVPFPNRLADGEYTFHGTRHLLPIDEHDRRTAIHGFGHQHLWTLASVEDDRVRLTWRVPCMTGYPFDLVVDAVYEVSASGLALTISAWNHGNADAPWAVGLHPWIANGHDGYGDEIDADNGRCRITVPARMHVTVNDRLLPTGTESVEGTAYDLRQPTTLTGRHFDDAWTDLIKDGSGDATATLTRPDGMTVSIQGDSTVTSFQVCTGTGFPAQTRPAGIAIEPQTAYADAFNSGIDLMVVHPDDTVSTTLSLSASMANGR
ncbi:aldose 1-epimerase family protein [uncultured Bifidobacterium sp.]|uniref:aldose 1-epimerase family protein n=1 Tax=uncultured Bifidobacterium sp. TaxID=165187 RepID=UPI002622DDCF|nr:aldose 1-epimerase family protein [uncultured Bifidobacterium sp.]